MAYYRYLAAAAALATLLATTETAKAEGPEGPSAFATTFKKIVDNCEKGKGIALKNAPLTITQDANRVIVSIEGLHDLRGKRAKNPSDLRADAKSQVRGMNVHYGLSGRLVNNGIQGVLVAEFFNGKFPVCTQSFRLSGKRRP